MRIYKRIKLRMKRNLRMKRSIKEKKIKYKLFFNNKYIENTLQYFLIG